MDKLTMKQAKMVERLVSLQVTMLYAKGTKSYEKQFIAIAKDLGLSNDWLQGYPKI